MDIIRLFQRRIQGIDIPSTDSSMPNIMGTCLKHIETDKLKKNEIFLTTKRQSGQENNISIPEMVQKRSQEVGHAFSLGEKCRISNAFLPNHMTKIAEYSSSAFCGTYCNDGKMLVTASQDNFLHMYNANNGYYHKFKTIFAQNVSWSILDTAVSPNGSHIAYSTWSDAIHLCPIHGDSNVQEAFSLRPEGLLGRFCVFSIVFSNDGRELLGAANDGCLYVYDCECHETIIKIKGHVDHVNAVALADNTSQILYSGSDDGLCKVWDKRTLSESCPKPVGVFAGHTDGITYVDSRGDGRYLVTNSKDQSIKLWDIRQFSTKKTQINARAIVANQQWDYRMHSNVPKELYISPIKLDGDTSVMTYRGGHLVVRTLIRCHFSPAVSTGQKYIYTGCGNGRVVIYDVLTGKVVRILEDHKGCVRDVDWHPYHQEIISTSWDGVIGCWRYNSVSKDSWKSCGNIVNDDLI